MALNIMLMGTRSVNMSIINLLFLPDVALKFISQWDYFALSKRLKEPIPNI